MKAGDREKSERASARARERELVGKSSERDLSNGPDSFNGFLGGPAQRQRCPLKRCEDVESSEGPRDKERR